MPKPELRSTSDGDGLMVLSALVQDNLHRAGGRVAAYDPQHPSTLSGAAWLQDRETERCYEAVKASMKRLGLWVEP